jgi:uridylate kinase
MASSLAYKRVLLKLSGEALMGQGAKPFDPATLERICGEIAAARAKGAEIAVVIGAGNLFRGAQSGIVGVERAKADAMGMLATVMNALALEGVLRNQLNMRPEPLVMSAIPMPSVCDSFSRDRALAALSEGRVVIFAGGTGNPYFTTDTAAALRAVEMGCDALLKATQVDGVYSADPHKDANARRFDKLTHREVIEKDLKIMDTAAVALTRENAVPIVVFSIHNPGALAEVVMGGGRRTVIE